MRIGLVAGEASGDFLGAELIGALRARIPDARFRGIAGPRMAAAGCTQVYDAEALSVMGLVEVLGRLPRLLSIRRGIARDMLEWRPDVFIGIDSPDFNLPLERRLRGQGLRTAHYVSPTVWAWRRGRVRTVARAADLVLALYPFEPGHYAGSGTRAVFVGHPLADSLSPERMPRGTARAALNLPVGARVVAVLPGSRMSEVSRLGPAFAATVAGLAVKHPGARFVAPMVSASLADAFGAMLAAHAPGVSVDIVPGRLSTTALAAADAALVASGTAALEAMLLHTPMVAAYRLSPLTAWILRRFRMLEVERFTLPNLIAGETLVPEFLQEAVDAGALCGAIDQLLTDPAACAAQVDAFARLHGAIAAGGSTAAADAVISLAETRRRGESTTD